MSSATENKPEGAKSLEVAYTLWVFLGFFSAHNFYLRRTRAAVAQVVIVALIPISWAFMVLFLALRAELDLYFLLALLMFAVAILLVLLLLCLLIVELSIM